jgi:Uma2 family endonuclease
MVAAPTREISAAPPEERMLLHGVGWKEYAILRELLDGPGLRMTYLKGALELMSPSPEHELWKKNIARLVELYAYVRGIDLRGYGSTTFKSEATERGAEPDECYLVGKKLADVPEIVLEVIYTPPRVDKLAVYAGLRVPEVWLFRDGAFAVHLLDASTGRYRAAPGSERLPELDLTVVARHATREDTLQALREFELAIRPA